MKAYALSESISARICAICGQKLEVIGKQSLVRRYIGRYGTRRVAKVVLLGSVTPLMLKTDANPGGLPVKAFDDIRTGVAAHHPRR